MLDIIKKCKTFYKTKEMIVIFMFVISKNKTEQKQISNIMSL